MTTFISLFTARDVKQFLAGSGTTDTVRCKTENSGRFQLSERDEAHEAQYYTIQMLPQRTIAMLQIVKLNPEYVLVQPVIRKRHLVMSSALGPPLPLGASPQHPQDQFLCLLHHFLVLSPSVCSVSRFSFLPVDLVEQE